METILPWIDSVVAGILVTIIIYLVYKFFKMKSVFKSLSEIYVQELADKMLLQKKVDELYQDIENTKLEQTDGFLKFVSDSRDWAYQYIEEVQDALTLFDSEMNKILTWNETYGSVLGENAHTEAIDKISLAYSNLKKLLPKETETPNN